MSVVASNQGDLSLLKYGPFKPSRCPFYAFASRTPDSSPPEKARKSPLCFRFSLSFSIFLIPCCTIVVSSVSLEISVGSLVAFFFFFFKFHSLAMTLLFLAEFESCGTTMFLAFCFSEEIEEVLINTHIILYIILYYIICVIKLYCYIIYYKVVLV